MICSRVTGLDESKGVDEISWERDDDYSGVTTCSPTLSRANPMAQGSVRATLT